MKKTPENRLKNSSCDPHDHIGCGCHHPAVDILLKKNKVFNKPLILDKKIDNEKQVENIFYIFYGGTIRPVTAGDGELTSEAMAIYQGRICAIGNKKDVFNTVNSLKKDDDFVEEIYLEGRTLLPGLIDPHVHIVPSSLMLPCDNNPYGFQDYTPFGHDEPTSDTDQNLFSDYSLKKLKEKIIIDLKKITEEGYWLLGNGVDTSLLKDSTQGGKTLLNCINADVLDELQDSEKDNQKPILLLSASLHTGYINTSALHKTWKYVEKNKDEYKDFYEKYENEENFISKTKGVLQELAEIEPALYAINEEQKDLLTNDTALRNNINDFLDKARSRGVTMLYDAGMEKDWWEGFKDLLGENDIRIGAAMLTPTVEAFKSLKKGNVMPDEFKKPESEDEISCFIGNCKVVSDGSNQGLTGYQSTPYNCPPEDHYGDFNYSDTIPPLVQPVENAPTDFQDLIKAINESKWPIMTHANGDLAVQFTIEAYKNAGVKKGSKDDLRHRIEHCSLLNNETIEDIQNLGLSPSFLIGHVGYWGLVFRDYIFNDKDKSKNKAINQLDLCQSVRKNKNNDEVTKISLHSDCTVSPVGPLRCMEQAYTRKLEQFSLLEGNQNVDFKNIPTLNKKECLKAGEALSAVTYQAAWQCHVNHLVGSLEPGKLADFIILEKDPVSMTEEEAYLKMRYIKVEEVWIGGRKTGSEKTLISKPALIETELN